MIEPTPAAKEPVAPEAPALPREAGPSLRRRDWLLGGLGGLAAGGAAGGWVGWSNRPQPSLPEGALISYAQCGEDLILTWWLKLLQVSSPRYLDIGVWEPVRSNNTYLLSLNGGRGVLVEPNPTLAETIRRARPHDQLLSMGVGLDGVTEADYYVFNDSSLNTFDTEQRDRILKDPHFRLERTVKLPLININQLMSDQFGGQSPDVLSIDVEGLELPILRTVDWSRFRPKIICTETLITLTRKHNGATREYLAQQGYEAGSQTYANTIFVDKALLK